LKALSVEEGTITWKQYQQRRQKREQRREL